MREEDLDAYRALRLRSLEADPLAFGSTLAREAAYPPERWADSVHRSAHSATEAAWVAERPDGRLGGLVVGVQTPDRAIHAFAMWVEPELRGRGVGGALLDRLLRWAQELDATARIVLSVNPTQAPAVRLYRGRGFRPTGVVEPIGHTPGAVAHEMEYRKSADGRGPD